MGNATTLEIIWTVLAAVGLVAGALAVWQVAGDYRLAKREAGAIRWYAFWLAAQWSGMAVVNLCLLVIGLYALTVPQNPASARNIPVSALALIVAAFTIVGVTVGYIVSRWWVLRNGGRGSG